MNCQEFDELWNELLDAETAAWHSSDAAMTARRSDPSVLELAATAHARSCSRCGTIHDRYERLRQALRASNSGSRLIAAPSPELALRIMAAAGAPRTRSRFWRAALLVGVASTAAVLLLALTIASLPWSLQRLPSGANAAKENRPDHSQSVQPSAFPARGPDLTEALADATEATWDLALTTSGPAARLGRRVIVAATSAQDSTGTDSAWAGGAQLGLDALAPVLRVVPDSTPGSELIQEVEDGLFARVRPLSSSARQAFGFLRTPSLGKPDHSINLPASKGA